MHRRVVRTFVSSLVLFAIGCGLPDASESTLTGDAQEMTTFDASEQTVLETGIHQWRVEPQPARVSSFGIDHRGVAMVAFHQVAGASVLEIEVLDGSDSTRARAPAMLAALSRDVDAHLQQLEPVSVPDADDVPYSLWACYECARLQFEILTCVYYSVADPNDFDSQRCGQAIYDASMVCNQCSQNF